MVESRAHVGSRRCIQISTQVSAVQWQNNWSHAGIENQLCDSIWNVYVRVDIIWIRGQRVNNEGHFYSCGILHNLAFPFAPIFSMIPSGTRYFMLTRFYSSFLSIGTFENRVFCEESGFFSCSLFLFPIITAFCLWDPLSLISLLCLHRRVSFRFK